MNCIYYSELRKWSVSESASAGYTLEMLHAAGFKGADVTTHIDIDGAVGRRAVTVGGLNYPYGVATGNELVFVAERDSHRIAVLRSGNGEAVRYLGIGKLNAPAGVAVMRNGGEEVFVSEASTARISVWSATTGAFLRTLVARGGSSTGKLRHPVGLALSLDGAELFVVDLEAKRIVVFDTTRGGFRRAIGGEDTFNSPRFCALSPDGQKLLVGDNNRLVVCDAASGGVERSWGSRGSALGQFDGLNGIALSPSGGELVVADSGNNRIQVFNANDGAFLRSWRGVQHPNGLAISADGRTVFVSSNQAGKLYSFE